ncbi:translation elongation factor 4 [Candidatus Annandia pinicola]|uniref:translation elongation factor 4 n=1 Tax=Candidatus Annandia pinicola TaxID=1345117 RepID=UPI001D02F499|nr:translation elongation factor 4 [Candidatus Annandia pinicola]UDG80321.1 Elongation factor 4 [Candidatus Annandia pinicola]
MKNTRNFSIIAHIDHGKSTLSDRFIQICNGLTNRNTPITQMLDSMDLERERGITIKARNVTLNYLSKSKIIYKLNLIDTPGHVDFSYEVSRSLSACEGAILLIDAGQGIEAQTLANYYTAIDMNLTIIPVLNKIDLPLIETEKILENIKNILNIKKKNIIKCSAKTGYGVDILLENIIKKIPSPKGKTNNNLAALVIDSWFDQYKGVVSLICIKNGNINKGDKIKFMSNCSIYHVESLGIFTPKIINKNKLKCGDIGWIICGIKIIGDAPVGDTITKFDKPINKSLPGFKKTKPQVYAGLFPVDNKNYINFKQALKKLSLNDSSFLYEKEYSSVLGFGFRCGFLGLLHMDIIKERLEREYNLDIIMTTPNVIYKVKTKNKIIKIDSSHKLLSIKNIDSIFEPIVECHIFSPLIYLGPIINLCIKKRGIQNNILYHGEKIEIIYEIPMMEVILNFFDKLKSISKGYASLDYKFKYFKKSDLVCLEILINYKKIDALSVIIHKKFSRNYGNILVKKLKNIIHRQQFDIIIQASINNKIIARNNIKKLRKNVISKCYGGDISRKKKLLEKQKIGKKKMKLIGNVFLPKKIFLTLLNIKK